MAWVMVSKEEKFNRLRLIRSPRIGPSTYWRLVDLFKSAKNAISALPELVCGAELKSYNLCSENVILKEIEALRKIGARLVFFEDELYPPLLREIPSPPPVLNFLGNKERAISLLDKKLLAVVGSRSASLNGSKLAFELSNELSEQVCIVSGLARGIDTSAHQGSLNNGTFSILAGGINKIYPRENKKLYEEILKTGGVFAEMPYDTYPSASLFPRRNSIIAGMSHGVLVVEATRKSGSLITAQMAKTFNRKIFAIPNSPMDARSQGGNDLIKDGAHIVTNSRDIIIGLNIKKELFSERKCLFEKEIDIGYKVSAKSIKEIKQVILQFIDAYDASLDEILLKIIAPPEKILRAIIELELAGRIKKIGANKISYIS